MKDFIELRRIFTIIARHLWLLVLLTSIGGLIGLLISRSQIPVYQATTTMLVGQFMESTSVNRTDIQTSADVAKTYADIAIRQPVLSEVVATLKLDEAWQELKKQVQVKAMEGTLLIEVTAEATSPATARAIADKVASQLIAISPTTTKNIEADTNYNFMRQQIESLKRRVVDGQTRLKEIDTALAVLTSTTRLAPLQEEKKALEQAITDWIKDYISLSDSARQESATNNYLTIIEPAQSTKDPVRPRIALDTIIAGVIGLFLALGLAFLRDYLDSSIHSSEQMEEVVGSAPLAQIGTVRSSKWTLLMWLAPLAQIGTESRFGQSLLRHIGKGQGRQIRTVGHTGEAGNTVSRKLVTLEQPWAPVSESFRTLRTNVQFTSIDRPLRSLVITSAAPKDGKTFVAANLAVVMAQIGKRVFLVDGDLRRPSVHAIFGLPNRSGLTNLILSGNEASVVQQMPDLPNLGVITSGPLPANPSELLNSQQVADVMANLAELADLVIYDAPPMGMVTDPAILGTRVDAVILVARAGVTRRNLILSAKQALQNVGVKLILPVLNGVPPAAVSTHHGYYGYGRYRTPPAESADVFAEVHQAAPASIGLRMDDVMETLTEHKDAHMAALVSALVGEESPKGNSDLATVAGGATQQPAPFVEEVAVPSLSAEPLMIARTAPDMTQADETALVVSSGGQPVATAPPAASPAPVVAAPALEAPKPVRKRKAAPVAAASAVVPSRAQQKATLPVPEVPGMAAPQPTRTRKAASSGAKPAMETKKPVRQAAKAAEADDHYAGLPVSNGQLDTDEHTAVAKGSSR